MNEDAEWDQLPVVLKACHALERYEIGDVVGAGSQGRVYRVRRRGENKPFALKVGLVRDEQRNSEVEYLELLGGSRHIVQMEHSFEVELPSGQMAYCVLLEWADQSLEDILDSLGPENALAPEEFYTLAKHLFQGLGELHGQGYLHCDLKPANVGVFEEGGARIFRLLDLGSVVVASKTTPKNTAATLIYCAPERLEEISASVPVSASAASDSYEAGATLLRTLGWTPDGSTRAHEEIDCTFARLENFAGWGAPRVASLKLVLEHLLRSAPADRSSLKEARRELDRWHEVSEARSAMVERDTSLKDAIEQLRGESEEKRNWKVLAFMAAGILLVVAGIAAHEMIGDAPWFLAPNGPERSNAEQPPDSLPSAVARLAPPILQRGTEANGFDDWFILIPGATAEDSIAVLPADGAPRIARALPVDETVPPHWRRVPEDLRAGNYWVVCDQEPGWKGELAIEPEIFGIDFLSGARREDGTPCIPAGRVTILKVRGRNLPAELTVLLGQELALPYQEQDPEGKPLASFRNSPVSMSYSISAPKELQKTSVRVFSDPRDYADGASQSYLQLVEVFSPAYDDLVQISKQAPDYFGIIGLVGTPAFGPIAENYRSSIVQLRERCIVLANEGLQVPTDLAMQLALNLQHFQAVVYQSRSERVLFKSRKSLLDMYNQQIERLGEMQTAWAALIDVCESSVQAEDLRGRKAEVVKVRTFAKWLVDGGVPTRPYMSTVSIALEKLIEREGVLNALDLEEESEQDARVDQLSSFLNSGWAWFEIGIQLIDADGSKRVYRHDGQEDEFLILPCAARISDERLLLDIDSSNIPSGFPRWQLGDRVKVGIKINWDEPGFGVGPVALPDREGAAWLDGIDFPPEGCNPPGYTYEILLTTWKNTPWTPEFNAAADALRAQYLAPTKSIRSLTSPPHR